MIRVIKSKTNLVGCHNDKSYVIGFRSLEHAHIVHRNISNQSKVEILHQSKRDVGDTINYNLKQHLGVQVSAFKSIEIDDDARLVIQKRQPSDDDLVIQEIPFQDFIMLPFYNHIGIVLPFELVHEYPDRFEFDCQTVDPVSDYKLFKMGGK
jgi:hypothetical protein